jgi:hypothetical protein
MKLAQVFMIFVPSTNVQVSAYFVSDKRCAMKLSSDDPFFAEGKEVVVLVTL